MRAQTQFNFLTDTMWKITFIVLLITIIISDCVEQRTFFGKIQSSLQLAGKLLGIDQAKGVAQLVSETFGKTHRKGDGANNTNNIFSGFLRVLGFDVKKIGAIAVNAIIFVAQLISSSLSRPLPSQLTEARGIHEGTPLDWMMNKSKVIDMMGYIHDKNLTDYVVEFIKERSLDEETDCVQLLVCKTSPFIWGMQKALQSRKNETIKGPKTFYYYLPTIEEVEDNGDHCDYKHPFCFIDL